MRAAINRLLPPGWYVRAAKPVRLPPDSKPEPDRCLVRGEIRDYRGCAPGPQDVHSSSRLRTRAWWKVANLHGSIPTAHTCLLDHYPVDHQVEVFTNPAQSGYHASQVLKPVQAVALVIDGVKSPDPGARAFALNLGFISATGVFGFTPRPSSRFVPIALACCAEERTL